MDWTSATEILPGRTDRCIVVQARPSTRRRPSASLVSDIVAVAKEKLRETCERRIEATLSSIAALEAKLRTAQLRRLCAAQRNGLADSPFSQLSASNDELRHIVSYLSPDDALCVALVCVSFCHAAFGELAAIDDPPELAAHHPPRLRTRISAMVAGSVARLRWAVAAGCPREAVCEAAAGGGHLEALRWARSAGCPWGVECSLAAARRGQLEVLVWAVGQGLEIEAVACADACRMRHEIMLHFLDTQRPSEPRGPESLQEQVVAFFAGSDDEFGGSIHACVVALQPAAEGDILAAVDELEAQGMLYSTIDDEHFLAT